MKETQERVGLFIDRRPVMKENDTVPRMADLLKVEIDEMMAEYWGDEIPTDEQKEKFALEAADCFIYMLSICNEVGIDAELIVNRKMDINEERFPEHLFQEGDFDTIYLARKIELGERNADQT